MVLGPLLGELHAGEGNDDDHMTAVENNRHEDPLNANSGEDTDFELTPPSQFLRNEGCLKCLLKT